MAHLRQALARWRYCHPEILERLGLGAHVQNRTERMSRRLTRIAEARARVEPRDATDVLLALLFLNNSVSRRVLERHLDREALSALCDMRILVCDGDAVRCEVTVSEFDGLYLASDTVWRAQFSADQRLPDRSRAYDAVCNPMGGTSFTFASTVTTRPGRRLLDLCTGCGVVALHASRFHREVLGIDNSARSLAFARFNQAFNQIENVAFVESDLYQAVEGRFDRIASNPPYIPCTDSQPGDNFYCGGSRGDALTSAILEGLDRHLEENGYCHLAGFFIHRASDPRGRLRISPDLSKYRESGYDTLLLTYEVPFRDPKFVSSTADFGDAERVEFGPYVLRRRAASARTGTCWSLRARFGGRLAFDVDQLFRALDTSENPRSLLHSFGVWESTS